MDSKQKQRVLQAFYNTLGEFLNQLIACFPNDPDFPAYKTAMDMMKMGNPALIPTEFSKNVTPFEATLRARDSKFFLEYSFSEIKEVDVDVIGKLKGLWTSLSASNQTIMFDYVILLLDLAARIQ